MDQLGQTLSHPAFVALQRRIVKHRAALDAALDHDLSNALIESTNTKIRLLTPWVVMSGAGLVVAAGSRRGRALPGR